MVRLTNRKAWSDDIDLTQELGYEHIYQRLAEYENLEELNYLASELEELGDYEYLHFQAAMQVSDYSNSIKDLINLVDNLDKYDVYPDTFSHEDLGRYCIEELHALKVPENLLNYIDY